MHIHILGVCGAFMGSLAQLAQALGYRVTGSDMKVYPPMSHQLERAGIEVIEGFCPSQLDLQPDMIVVGNVISRGNPVMEAVLNRGLPYISGPQWLAENILRGKWVLGVAGTHGKTTTSSMLAWILEYAGMEPGYLIGGIPGNFNMSARLGKSDFFVIEADEYDTSFFDKRSKFVHYQPRTLILNNLEYDHADIFPDIDAIKRQFHHLVRTVPSDGLITYPKKELAIQEVLKQGCWSEVQAMHVCSENGWREVSTAPSEWSGIFDDEHSELTIRFLGEEMASTSWNLLGEHTLYNAVNAVIAARHVGVLPQVACDALLEFKGVKRRMEHIGKFRLSTTGVNVKVFDDFAHHPTAIKTTLEGVRKKFSDKRIVVIVEPRSNTMKSGVHKDVLLEAVAFADYALWFEPADLDWDITSSVANGEGSNNIVNGDIYLKGSEVFSDTQRIIERATQLAKVDTVVVIMSNGGFEGIHRRLLDAFKLLSEEGV